MIYLRGCGGGSKNRDFFSINFQNFFHSLIEDLDRDLQNVSCPIKHAMENKNVSEKLTFYKCESFFSRQNYANHTAVKISEIYIMI